MAEPVGPERALQLAVPAPVPAAVATAVNDILTGTLTLTQAFTRTVEALSQGHGVDRVAAVSMRLRPDREDAWVRLGDRAWLMEWALAGAEPTGPAGKDAGSGQAMSLPWFSQQVRRHGVVGITDARLLDGPAAADRVELDRTGASAVLGSSMMRGDVMFGSLAVGRTEPGPWHEETVASVQLLSAALATLMSATHDRAALAESLARAEEAREGQHLFFSALGHELRTPISAIIGTAELLGEEAQELADDPDGAAPGPSYAPSVAKDASVMLSAAEQLLAVIDALLETGQELRGRDGGKAAEVGDAVSDVVHWLRAPALAAGVTVSYPPDLSLRVATMPSALRQVLANLIGNAIAHNHPGGAVSVTTSTSADEHGRPRVRITVHDTGPGLTLEQQSEVFKPFVRFAGPQVRGTGLGLALSRTIAEGDGGLMGVESVLGQGAAFWVDLPAASTTA
jgi:signal transduction histidine kinase